MKKVFCTAVLLTVFSTLALAQGQPAARPQAAPQQQPQQQQQAAAQIPYRVAVVDLAVLIKQHPLFELKMQEFQKKVTMADEELQKRHNVIRAEAVKLEGMKDTIKPGTQPYVERADKIAADMAQLEIEAKKRQRDFILENSQIMYDIFMDVRGEIGTFVENRGVAMVVDHRKIEVSPNDPQALSEEMDKNAVWVHPHVDLTAAIQGRLAEKYKNIVPPPVAAPQPGTAPINR